MRVLLFNPPFHRLMSLETGNFHLGLGYLATFLKANGHECIIYDMELPLPNESSTEYEVSDNLLDKLSSEHNRYVSAVRDKSNPIWAETKHTITEYRPELVGITAMSTIFASALNIASAVKEVLPTCPVVVGGPHATILPNECLSHDVIDFVVMGEGERTLFELVESLENRDGRLEEIDGLAFRNNGKSVVNKPRMPEPDINRFPYPDRTLLINGDRYRSLDSFGSIITSRGCPFNCGFCGARSIWGKRVRFRNVENVIAEILEVRDKYGVNKFNFWDNTFTVNRRMTVELCRRLIDNRLDITWGCLTRLDRIDEELLRLMKRAGCRRLEIGVESGSQRILDYIGKEIDKREAVEKTRLIKKSGIFLSMFFMIGFPPETEHDIRQTTEFLNELDPDKVSLSVFTPYPGTPIYEDARQSELIPEDINWSTLSHQSLTTHFVRDITRDRFREIVEDTVRLFDKFNSKKALSRDSWRTNLKRNYIQMLDEIEWAKSEGKSARFAIVKRYAKHLIKATLARVGLWR